MTIRSSATILFDTGSLQVPIVPGPIPVNQSGFMSLASDGSEARYIRCDGSGNLTFSGAGSAGTPGGGVVTVQGDAGGTPIPVSVSHISLATDAATETTLATLLKESTFTGRVPTLGQHAAASSWSVVLASDQATIPVSTASLPLPVGAATETTLTTLATESSVALLLKDSTFTARMPTTGQKVSASSLPVVLASDHSAVAVTTASLPLPAGAATEVTLATLLKESTFTARVPTLGQKAMAASTPVVIASDQNTLAVSTASLPLPAGAATETTLATVVKEATFTTRIPTLGQKVMSGSVPVTVASDHTPIEMKHARAQRDAFGRLRVSESYTIFDSKQLFDTQALDWHDVQLSGGGTSTAYNTNQASTTISATGNIAGRRVRQTYECFNYQPGKSQLILMTGILGTPVAGISRRIGQFNDNNGFYIESGPTEVSLVVRSFVSGIAVNTTVAQSAWNVDKMNGSGASGITLDFSKVQIFGFFYEWLGVGSVWAFVVIGGEFHILHRFDQANIGVSVYMGSPNLPLRYEIVSTGTGTAAVSNLTHICSTIMSEGGSIASGRLRALTRTTALTTNNDANYYVLAAVRIASGYIGSVVQLFKTSIICTSTAAFSWRIIRNPVVAGTALTFTALTGSPIEYDISRTATTTVTVGPGSVEVASGVAQAAADHSVEAVFADDISMGVNASGTADIYVIAVSRLTGTTETFYGALNWHESF